VVRPGARPDEVVIEQMVAQREGGLDTVLCDVGDVIISFDLAVAADIEVRHGLDPDTLLPVALKSPAGRAAMVGAIDHDEWRRATAAVVGDAAINAWLAYHGEANQAVVALLKALKNQNVRVVLLSNATARLWDDLAFHGLDGLADAVFCSADIALAKPNAASYRFAAEHGDFILDRALYVDDTPSWVAAGAALGLQGHVYTSPDRLARELTAAGLLR
jgi:putative hydrolase of the HAD superfamily